MAGRTVDRLAEPACDGGDHVTITVAATPTPGRNGRHHQRGGGRGRALLASGTQSGA